MPVAFIARFLSLRFALAATLFVAAAGPLVAQERPALIRGVVVDSVTARPLRLATIRPVDGTTSLLTDDDGRFRLELPRGVSDLEIRRIGYRPTRFTIDAAVDTTVTIRLSPLPFEIEELRVSAEGPDPAEAIIRRAIERKQNLQRRLQSYGYDGTVKFTVTNPDKPADSASSILLITESQIEARWDRPDRYHERIVARRQSRNVAAENNLVTVGEILNFARNRIDLGPVQVVSPIADDALDSYRYRILDTLATSAGRAIRLAILPRSNATTLFTGVIDIVDSTYQVLGLDVGLNSTAELSFVENLRYRQVLADQGDDRWLPREVQLTGEIRFRVPFPGLPRRLRFEHLAVIEKFRFDLPDRPADAGVRVVVDEKADDPDSTRWNRPNAVPLTPVEARAWQRIDSVERKKRTGFRRVWRAVLAQALDSTAGDFFHFNRVDGAYLGAGATVRATSDLILSGNAGYATSADRIQFGVGADLRIARGPNAWIWWHYHDETAARPTFPSEGRGPTFEALFARRDPLDYYREDGQTLGLRIRPILPLELAASFNDFRQTSVPIGTDFSIARSKRATRPNPPITDGRLRSIVGSVRYDSRPILRSKGLDRVLPAFTWTWIRAQVEVSDPSLIRSDFSFRRYQLDVQHRRRIGDLGIFTISAQGGVSDGTLPPQRFFAIDFGDRILGSQMGGFVTLGDTTYSGTRSWAVRANHDFGRRIIASIPLVRRLPFTTSVHGGLFRTEHPGTAFVGSEATYSELGFGLNNLTPFLSPFNLGLSFNWQLSNFPTHGFRIAVTTGN